MAKLKKPLLSLQAIGSLAKSISFRRSRGKNIAGKKPEVPDAKTLAQLSWRHMYQKAVALWHALSDAEKQEWESLARPKHMTGFAWFISQALKPNPGLYLPLQGGKMAGDIDLDKHRVLKLPLPTDDQEAASKKYHDDNLPAGPYTQGCRLYHSVAWPIPNTTFTTLTFNTEDYDTDAMHDPLTNPARITFKTPGIYLITFHAQFAANDTGYRVVLLLSSNPATIARFELNGVTGTYTPMNLTTIWQATLNEYITIMVYQNSGNTLDIRKEAKYSPYFMAQRIG
ncbi:hypothetical protein ES708_13780 [subsurface metagenome]